MSFFEKNILCDIWDIDCVVFLFINIYCDGFGGTHAWIFKCHIYAPFPLPFLLPITPDKSNRRLICHLATLVPL
jgi:hypothetical protein